ncbi:MAG TPA: sigma-70 family RNA polymerase sigma factor [Planctomycetota bacterium]|nr:sigma-70 family RNA polymerase sigma factor [Planctomycetota bacterium]
MSSPETTSWTLVESAAAGDESARQSFARHYLPAVEAYLAARWRGSRLIEEKDDAAQEVFLECFRSGGVLDRVERERAGGFRAFLYGVTRNVARRFETRAGRRKDHDVEKLDDIERDEPTLSRAFDRAWVVSRLREAWEALRERAARENDEALGRRIELLRLRSEEGLPIRDIAARWNVDAAVLHEDYRRVRNEFRQALIETIAFHRPCSPAEAEKECAELLGLLG